MRATVENVGLAKLMRRPAHRGRVEPTGRGCVAGIAILDKGDVGYLSAHMRAAERRGGDIQPS